MSKLKIDSYWIRPVERNFRLAQPTTLKQLVGQNNIIYFKETN